MPGLALRSTAIAFVLLASPGFARADVIFQSEAIGLNGGPLAFEQIVFEPFDPSLGELTEATFSVNLSLLYTATTALITDPHGVPVLTHVFGTADLVIDGLIWPFHFEAANCITNASISSGQTAVFPLLLNMTWRSGAGSNTFGFTLGEGSAGACMPSVINPVQLDDYLATPITAATGLMTDIRSIWSVAGSPGSPVPTVGGGGLAMLRYDYTPFPDVTVAAPGTAVLLAIGLACLGFTRRKLTRRA